MQHNLPWTVLGTFERGELRLHFRDSFQPNGVRSCIFLSLRYTMLLLSNVCVWFCSVLLQAVCEEAVKNGPRVGLSLDAVVFGGEDFRASIGVKDTFLLSFSLCLCVYIFSLPLEEWAFTWQYQFANHDHGQHFLII